jgi:hypothetical protein
VPASSRLRCHTRCATSSPPRRAECVDLGSEPARERSGTGVDPSLLTTRRRSGGEGAPRSGLDPARTARLDKAGTPTSPAWPARRGWDHPRTSRGTARTVEAVVQHRRGPAARGARPEPLPRGHPVGEATGFDSRRLLVVSSELRETSGSYGGARSIHANGATPSCRGCERWPCGSGHGSASVCASWPASRRTRGRRRAPRGNSMVSSVLCGWTLAVDDSQLQRLRKATPLDPQTCNLFLE